MKSSDIPTEGSWDAWNAQGGPKYPHEKVIQFCFRNYKPEARQNVRALDLGCGSGVHTLFLVSEGFNVTGVDPSESGIANTRRLLEGRQLVADLLRVGAEAIDFPPESFELIICIGVIDAVGPKLARKAMTRLAGILAKGGRGLFLFASDRDFRIGVEHPFGVQLHGYTRKEVDDLFAETFAEVWIDHYITTYQGGRSEQNDWLVTVRN